MEPKQPSTRESFRATTDPPLSRRSIQIWLAVIVASLFTLQIYARKWPPQDTGLRPNVDTSVTRITVQIDINAAAEREFSLLPSVGPILAKRIVDERRDNGPFESLEDLTRVHGIGDKKVAQMSSHCVAGRHPRDGNLSTNTSTNRERMNFP